MNRFTTGAPVLATAWGAAPGAAACQTSTIENASTPRSRVKLQRRPGPQPYHSLLTNLLFFLQSSRSAELRAEHEDYIRH